MAFRDWLNRLIPLKELNKPVAAPEQTGYRQVTSNHPADGLTVKKLSQIHKLAANHEPEAYFELAEDIEERDPHYAGVLSTRKRSVAQLPIVVTPASDSAEHKKHAALVQSWIDDEVFQAAAFDILDAIGKGLSVLEIEWKYHLGNQMPVELIYRPQRWFQFDLVDGETVLLREGVAGEPLPEHKFIIHKHKSKSGLTIRSGIARVASWAWMYKAFTMRDWAIFCQNFGQPLRLGRYGPNASEEEKDGRRLPRFASSLTWSNDHGR